ncbi:MAG TPA: hypothetical protein DCE03_00655 [Synergistaceae bacterium]|nr:hypothetical protein [Synergistaceae bacterium]
MRFKSAFEITVSNGFKMFVFAVCKGVPLVNEMGSCPLVAVSAIALVRKVETAFFVKNAICVAKSTQGGGRKSRATRNDLALYRI